MRRKLLIALLALGTVGGYSAGIAGMHCRAHARKAAIERHIAKVCVDAARAGKTGPNDAEQDGPSDW